MSIKFRKDAPEHWGQYTSNTVYHARPYMPGEDMTEYFVMPTFEAGGSPKEGDMIIAPPMEDPEYKGYLMPGVDFQRHFTPIVESE